MSGEVWQGARFYQPATASFTARDTVFGELSTPMGLNRYLYAFGDPLSFFDPDGRFGIAIDGIAGATSARQIQSTARFLPATAARGTKSKAQIRRDARRIAAAKRRAAETAARNKLAAEKAREREVAATAARRAREAEDKRVAEKRRQRQAMLQTQIDEPRCAGLYGSCGENLAIGGKGLVNGLAGAFDTIVVGTANLLLPEDHEFVPVGLVFTDDHTDVSYGVGQATATTVEVLSGAKAVVSGGRAVTTAVKNWDETVATARTAVRSVRARAAAIHADEAGSIQIAPGASGSGPVKFRPPPGATPEEIAQVRAYCQACNEALAEGALSPTGRVSTAGELRAAASRAAAQERAAASVAGRPYAGHAGHVPDTTWTASPAPWGWMDLSPRVNMSLGGQAARYPVGWRPTEFIFDYSP